VSPETVPLKIRKLTPDDDRSGFRSGNADLDRFFTRYAGQNQFRHHIGTTYVAVDGAGIIVGFATVAASELVPETIPASKRKKNLPKYPLLMIHHISRRRGRVHRGGSLGGSVSDRDDRVPPSPGPFPRCGGRGERCVQEVAIIRRTSGSSPFT